VPELTETKSEPKSVTDLYGEEVHKAGSLAHSMLLARRMTERGVRFVQIYHNNWDHHANLTGRMKFQCKRPRPALTFGLLTDLKQRGMLDDTLVIWGGEFGRTIYSQGQLSHENYGRDHHPRCFTMWMAGGGSKGGHIHGETDDFSYNITRDPVHVRDSPRLGPPPTRFRPRTLHRPYRRASTRGSPACSRPRSSRRWSRRGRDSTTCCPRCKSANRPAAVQRCKSRARDRARLTP
jgi:hypothetical protein